MDEEYQNDRLEKELDEAIANGEMSIREARQIWKEAEAEG